jgi:large subunit ribosomal protein L10
MNSTEKKEWGESFKKDLEKATVSVFADYKGLTATQADQVRKLVRDSGGKIRVLKNNVARVTVKQGFSDDVRTVLDGTVGPTMVAFSFGDPSAVAKAVFNFAKDNEALKLKDSLLGLKKMQAADIEALAKLPSKEVMVAMFLGVLNAPARNFVSVLAAVPRGLVTVLSAIEKKKAGN